MQTLRIITLVTLVSMLSACGLKPETIKNAFVGHAAFPSLAVAIQSCIAERPDVQAAITPAWNRTFDKWVLTKNLKPDADLLVKVAGFPSELAEAERDAMYIESVIIDAGLDCGSYVRSQWGNIKVTFTEIKTAVSSSQRIVEAAEWATLLSAILQGRREGDVTRMPVT